MLGAPLLRLSVIVLQLLLLSSKPQCQHWVRKLDSGYRLRLESRMRR